MHDTFKLWYGWLAGWQAKWRDTDLKTSSTFFKKNFLFMSKVGQFLPMNRAVLQ